MKPENLCPCCSEPLLRHARHGSIYWFCSHCWQEMPNLLEMEERKTEKLLVTSLR